MKSTEAEIDKMNVIENLKFAIIEKFSYGQPTLDEIQNIIPEQCGLKVDFFHNIHVLIRCAIMEDFINFMS